MKPTLSALVADLSLLSDEPDCPASRLGALSQMQIVWPPVDRDPALNDADSRTQAVQAVVIAAVDRLGSSRVGRALAKLLNFDEDAGSAGDREARAAEALGETVRTVQRNRDKLFGQAAEQLLYMEMEALHGALADTRPRALGHPVGWDGFFMERFFTRWSMHWDGAELVHSYEREVDLISGGVGTAAIPIGFVWTGSGSVAVSVSESLPTGVHHTSVPRALSTYEAPFDWELFFLGRALGANERISLAFRQVARDPDCEILPTLAWQARTDASLIQFEIAIPHDCLIEEAQATAWSGRAAQRQPAGETALVSRGQDDLIAYEWPAYAVREGCTYQLELDTEALREYASSRS